MTSFTLDPYAARSCLHKTINSFTPGLVPPRNDAPLPPFFHDPEAVENDVFGQLQQGVTSVADLRELRGAPSAEQESAALAALAAGTELVIAPLLPRDTQAHRAGRPSALLRVADGYVPLVVKFHRVLESAPVDGVPLDYSILPEPQVHRAARGRVFRWGSRLSAALQAAHLWRLLETTGYAASSPVAGVIGTERITPDDTESRRQHLFITWLKLDEPCAAPHPATVDVPEEADPISTLERYDFEHARRIELALAARDGRTEELPLPAIHGECTYCRWHDHCAAQLADDDLSKTIAKAPLDPHEVRTLRSLGFTTVPELAAADLEALLVDYLPRVSHRDGGERRLRLAHRRARMLVDGVELERTSAGPLDLPTHSLEIDFDIETSADDRAYLWGFYVDDRRSGERYYRAFARFDELDAAAERALAAEAFGWLRSLVAGRDAAVYHYSDYEVVRVHRMAHAIEAHEDESLAALACWAAACSESIFIDLFALVKAHFFGANGLGLKVVATAATGFSWRDNEPGGLASQSWFDEAVHAAEPADREAARQRVLEYNEDDCRATWHLRHYLRTLS